MSTKDALEYIISRLYSKSSCGRLSEEERKAIRILRKYFDEHREIS